VAALPSPLFQTTARKAVFTPLPPVARPSSKFCFNRFLRRPFCPSRFLPPFPQPPDPVCRLFFSTASCSRPLVALLFLFSSPPPFEAPPNSSTAHGFLSLISCFSVWFFPTVAFLCLFFFFFFLLSSSYSSVFFLLPVPFGPPSRVVSPFLCRLLSFP